VFIQACKAPITGFDLWGKLCVVDVGYSVIYMKWPLCCKELKVNFMW
jgi:hypothetical protein